MNCQKAQNHLLSLPRPDAPPLAVRQHLDECAGCQGFQTRLLGTEEQVRRMSVPAPRRKAEFLLQFTTPAAEVPQPILRIGTMSGTHATLPRKERGLQKLAIAIALAASMVFFALCWWLWPRSPATEVVSAPAPTEPTNETLLAARLKNSERWNKATTPKARFEALAFEADDVHKETTEMLRKGQTNELTAQARLYRAVVQQGILKQAETMELSPSERYMVLTDVANRLEETRLQAEAAAQRSPEATKAAFTEIALAAREGRVKLRQLAERT